MKKQCNSEMFAAYSGNAVHAADMMSSVVDVVSRD